MYADIRCLQDPNYAFRGVGHHSISILKYSRHFLGPSFQTVGLLDPSMDSLPEEYAKSFDSLEYTCGEISYGKDDIFIQPSPMTHDSSRYGKFIGRKNVLSAAIIYDFIPLQFERERYLPKLEDKLMYSSALIWTKQHDLFFPISEYSKRQLIKLLNVSEEKSYVTGVAVRNSFKRISNNQSVSEKSKFEPGNYFIVVGGGDSRKNVEVVLKAQAKLLSTGSIDAGIIIIGSYSSAQHEHLIQVFEKNGGTKAKLQFLMGISDQELAALYKHAIAAIAPSKIEGFSIPIIEAIALKCPVLASSCDAHLELIKQKDALFNPNNSNQLASLMKKINCNQNFRKNLLTEQKLVAEGYAEEKVAEKFWNRILQELEKQKKWVRIKSKKPRIAFITPYPPDCSGVADYSAHCLRSLSQYADIDVYTDAIGYMPSSNINSFKPISTSPYISAEYDRVISVMGNSPFHTKILKNLKSFGGCCIAHDASLLEYYFSLESEKKALEMASQRLGRTVLLDEICTWIKNPKILPTIFFDELIIASQPLIVHSKVVQSNIMKLYSYRPAYLPFSIYHEFQDNELTSDYREKVRSNLKIPKEQLVIISLGHVADVKGPCESVYAIDILRKKGLDAHLHFVGKNNLGANTIELVESLGLQGCIHCHNQWLSNQEYRNYILAADFAIQLRKHYYNPLSGAISDCISAGLPVVSNHDMVQAMDAADVAYTVPNDLNPVLIAEKIYEAYQLGRHKTRLSEERTRYIEAHNFDLYARGLINILNLD